MCGIRGTAPKGNEKPRLVSAEKKRLSGTETEHKLIVGIPPLRRLGGIGIEFQLIAIMIQVEHVRVDVPVCNICDAIRITARPDLGLGCILFESKTPKASHTKLISFSWTKYVPLPKKL